MVNQKKYFADCKNIMDKDDTKSPKKSALVPLPSVGHFFKLISKEDSS